MRTVPAKYKVLNTYSLGILPFISTTAGNTQAAEEITSSLYEVLRIKRFYKDIKHLSYPKGMDRRETNTLSAADVGRIAEGNNVDIVIKGNVFKHLVDVDQSKRKVDREVGTGKYRYEPYYEDGQRKLRRVEIKEVVSEEMPVVEKLAKVGFEIDLLNLSQKKWTDHDRFYKEKEYSAEGSTEVANLPHDSAILSNLTSALVKEAVDNFVPHAVAEKRVLTGCPGCKEGLAFAKKGDWTVAIASWESAITSDPENHGAHYNTGIAKEALKDYTSALENYKKAAEISEKPSYLEAIHRVGKIMEDEKTLIEQTRGKK